jgi:L-lactate dehydrogenase complex protein LldG
MKSQPPNPTKDELFSRIHHALGNVATPMAIPDPPAVNQSIARLASADDDLPAMFHTRAAAVGMHIHRPKSDELVNHIVEFLKEQGAKSVALDHAPFTDDLPAALTEAGISMLDWREDEKMDQQYDTDCGITGVAGCLAESGTLIVETGANTSRGLSLIPSLHIAIVRESDILPDMLDYWARKKGIHANEIPACFVFITGPSKTADIEGELVTGVHGPKEVHIMLVDES